VREPVQYRPGEALGSAHLGPLLEGQVRRHDQAHPLVRTTDDLEQQLGSELTEWDILWPNAPISRPPLARRHAVSDRCVAMTLARQRKIFLGVGAAALVALGADRIFLGSSLSGPESAVASSITDSSQADSAAGADIDALLHDDDPTAATSLAQRVNQVSRYRPGLLEDRRDAFKPSAGWVGVDGSGSGLPTNADGFRAAYELVALMPKNRRPCAMVGGRTVFVGQTLDGFTLVEVGARSAVFESVAGRVELKMGDGAASH